MTQIFLKEFNGFLNSLIGYLVMGVFLVAMGLLMWVFPESAVLDYGYADMGTLFSLAPFVFIFLVPAITMRSFAEEKKMGTLELLLTKPLTEFDIVTGKFMASLALVVIAILPTGIYYFSLYELGNPPGNIDTPGIIGSYIGLISLGAVFCAIGVFASSITPNQIVSFVLAAFFCFVFYQGFDSMAGLFTENALWLKQFGILSHYESMSRGLIDSRDIIYFLTVSVFMLLSTKISLSSRSW
ncbi:MAG TPA: gliding motility-associated ABC transporter permease subunit GldF [Cyclobacteriaceae bacterium]|nr:gliding motility-associated ABC transporter permease subunit GldF [Cyclobacteriaceae bacterium]